jgi:DnaJ-class molecular chaperone
VAHSYRGAAMSTGDGMTCAACLGTGKVLSSLGGTPHEVVCPWCEGSGHRIPGIDAQEHPAEGGDPASEAASADGVAPTAETASEADGSS